MFSLIGRLKILLTCVTLLPSDLSSLLRKALSHLRLLDLLLCGHVKGAQQGGGKEASGRGRQRRDSRHVVQGIRRSTQGLPFSS